MRPCPFLDRPTQLANSPTLGVWMMNRVPRCATAAFFFPIAHHIQYPPYYKAHNSECVLFNFIGAGEEVGLVDEYVVVVIVQWFQQSGRQGRQGRQDRGLVCISAVSGVCSMLCMLCAG